MILEQITDLRINPKAREWCKLSYPDHKRGCPNYGHKAICPPTAPLIQDYFDLSKPLYLLAIRFDLEQHAQRMKQANPKWSDRQARCVLYWQSRVNSELDKLAKGFCGFMGRYGVEMIYTLCPEAMGVNVIATAQGCGIPVKVKPTQFVYKIAFVGVKGKYVPPLIP